MSKIIYALDYSNYKDARKGAKLLHRYVGMFKIGTELFTAEGPKALKIGEEFGLRIFLDLKLHDIPITVARTVDIVAALGVKFLTTHCLGGAEMLRSAVNAASCSVDIAAVTILSSLNDKDLDMLCLPSFPSYLTLKYAQMAHKEGVRTFVCSPKELKSLRKLFGKDVTLIAPGIRSDDMEIGDQKRIGTPHEAQQYADWIVVGRMIRNASDPVEMAQSINSEYM